MDDSGVEVEAWMNFYGDIEVAHAVASQSDEVEIHLGGVSLQFDERALASCTTAFTAALDDLRTTLGPG